MYAYTYVRTYVDVVVTCTLLPHFLAHTLVIVRGMDNNYGMQ